MALKLPPKEDGSQPKKAQMRDMDREDLAPGDFIEYGMTVEVSLERGRKAWVKYGTTSGVRKGESTADAVARIARHVNNGIDERLDDLS